MLIKSMTAALLGTAMLATTAMAQTATTMTTTTPTATTADAASSSYQGNWRASKVVGLNVYNDSNESLGAINDLLMDKNGKIVAAVIGVGGFLGVGERYVAIPFDKVKFVNEPMATTASNTGGAMPGAKPAPTTTTGAATGATTPMATPATPKANPWYPDHAVISATKDELKSMPEFKYAT